MFKERDRVIWEGDPRRLKATIVKLISDGNYWLPSPTHAEIEFDDWQLIPRRMKVPVVELVLESSQVKPFVASEMEHCNCGLKYCRDGGKHSTWCNMYKGDI
jgi:hypothetical protein